MSAPFDLALVIPVHNDADGLVRLLAQARAAGWFSQIVVVDDASAVPVAAAPDLTLMRNKAAKGSGAARNRGLTAVTATHVLFFDADDMLTGEMGALLADLADETEPFDVCLFKYADSREARAGHWGQPAWDERFWTRAGIGPRALAEAPAAALPVLAQTANYPWNKIYRTDFLRSGGIGCAPTRVHNDVPLHWLGFLAASRVLVSDRICAWHEVRVRGGRLTNKMGSERLRVFEALAPAARAAAGAEDPAWRAGFAAFALGLVDWIAERIAPAHRDALAAAERAFLAGTLVPWLPEIDRIDPSLAARLAERGLTEGAGQ